MSARSLFLCVLIACTPVLAKADDALATYRPCDPAGLYDARFQSTAAMVPWETWTNLLNVGWSDEALRTRSLFDTKAVLDAMKSVTGNTRVRFDSPDETTYTPASASTPEQTQAYRAAADLYHAENYQAALPAFDAIAKDSNTPYRAAAAYSALRSLFLLGRYQEGVERLSAFLSAPDNPEFLSPALHLIGTLAYQSGSPELIAAHYVEMKHFLTAPARTVCYDAVLRDTLFGSNDNEPWNNVGYADDLAWYLSSIFEENAPRQTNYTRRMVLDTLAKQDPFFDLLRAIAAPSRFTRDYGWNRTEAPPLKRETLAPTQNADGESKDNPHLELLPIADAAAITEHARERAIKTKNPLWGFALAKRTDALSDLPLIEEMIAALDTLPKTEASDITRASLQQFFVLHGTRLLLLANKTDDALAFLKRHPMPSVETVSTFRHGVQEKPQRILLNGGLRLLLARFDLENARKWAKGAAPLLAPAVIDLELRPLLALSVDEMMQGKVPGDAPKRAEAAHLLSQQIPPSALLDLYPTSKLLELAKKPGLGAAERRLLLGSSLARVYATKGWADALALLPEVREAFPELAADIDAIENAWLPKTKSHLFTHLMLRVPGFGLRPSWARSAYAQAEDTRYEPRDRMALFTIDDRNPNDGNWWCALNIDETKRDFVTHFFIRPLRLDRGDTLFYREPLFSDLKTPHSYENDAAYKEVVLALANRVIAWHPLAQGTANEEWAALSKVQNGPKLLGEQTLDWKKGSSMASRIVGWERPLPEALHLAVRATRFGCRAEGSLAPLSKAAFKALHRDYPWSEWTVKTPYWFDKIGWAADEN